MRYIGTGLASHLASGATTLCHCWRVARRDGVVLGFTDHDESIAFSGTTFASGSGLEATAFDTKVGLATGGADVTGALSSDDIVEADIANGLFDSATIEVWLVNWQAPEQRLLLNVATIGEIHRSEFGFSAEMRGLAHLFDQERGRLFQSACDADLGDARCRVDMRVPGRRVVGSVAGLLEPTRISAALPGFAEGWFSQGILAPTSGANAGVLVQVRQHRQSGDIGVLELWTPPAATFSIGDEFILTAGCDKRLSTCRDKFGNTANFRGCPAMPGNDVVMSYPSGAVVMDGGSLLR